MDTPKPRPRLLELGRQIQLRREAAKLTQATLAKLIRRPEDYVATLEDGTIDPSIDTVREIAAVLNADFRSILRLCVDADDESTIGRWREVQDKNNKKDCSRKPQRAAP